MQCRLNIKMSPKSISPSVVWLCPFGRGGKLRPGGGFLPLPCPMMELGSSRGLWPQTFPGVPHGWELSSWHGRHLAGLLAISTSLGHVSSIDREAALWEVEEHHLQERHQLVKQQLKDQYFLQRHELVRKHEKVRLLAGAATGRPHCDGGTAGDHRGS